MRSGSIIKASIGRQLDAAALKMLANKAESRYQSAVDPIEALDALG